MPILKKDDYINKMFGRLKVKDVILKKRGTLRVAVVMAKKENLYPKIKHTAKAVQSCIKSTTP